MIKRIETSLRIATILSMIVMLCGCIEKSINDIDINTTARDQTNLDEFDLIKLDSNNNIDSSSDYNIENPCERVPLNECFVTRQYANCLDESDPLIFSENENVSLWCNNGVAFDKKCFWFSNDCPALEFDKECNKVDIGCECSSIAESWGHEPWYRIRELNLNIESSLSMENVPLEHQNVFCNISTDNLNIIHFCDWEYSFIWFVTSTPELPVFHFSSNSVKMVIELDYFLSRARACILKSTDTTVPTENPVCAIEGSIEVTENIIKARLYFENNTNYIEILHER